MKNIVLYGHGGSNNHGCEAIVKSTLKIFEKNKIEANYILSTLDIEADNRFISKVNNYIANSYIKPKSLKYFMAAISNRFFKSPILTAKFMYASFFREIKKLNSDSLFLSIGGDNYCCAFPLWLYLHNRSIDKLGAKRVLWGCSVEPETISEEMVSDLCGYSLIITRESITFQALQENNVKTGIKLFPDPAFVLEVDRTKVPAYFKKGKVVGLNLSPLITGYGRNTSIVYNNYRKLIKHIINTTEYNIVLIPHVAVEGNNDYKAMEPLFEEFEASNRVFIVGEGYSASQYKGIIASCDLFVGARTHSTIAAYSACVPTLALGYSVKALGIARDIFGTEKDMVVSAQSMNKETDLIYAFENLDERKEEVRNLLNRFMPSYIEKAWQAGKEIKLLLEDRGNKCAN
jgi:polysaccharide pyruvyl transferase WcaK-like protein